MPNRYLYNVQGLFVGPAPASGYHFLSELGELRNDYENAVSSGYTNLIFPLHRVTSFDYQINTERTKLVTFGKVGSVANVMLNPPPISFNFTYHTFSLINEARLGFIVNYMDPYSGTPALSDTFSVSLLYGLLTRENTKTLTSVYWPSDYRDCRNFYLGVGRTTEDLNTKAVGVAGSQNTDVWGFGNCYITSYITSAAVGEFPRTTVSCVAENAIYYYGCSGLSVPAVDLQIGSGITGTKFILPSMYDTGNYPSVILPGNISLTFSGSSEHLGTNITGMHIQAYEISMNLDRQPLYNLGYRFPMDRIIRMPVFVNFSLDIILHEINSGGAENFFKTDTQYSIDIECKDRTQATAIHYYLRGAKFLNATYQQAIGNQWVGRFNFETEIDPEDFSKGLFISGSLGLFPSIITNCLRFDGDTFEYLLFDPGGERILLEQARQIVY